MNVAVLDVARGGKAMRTGVELNRRMEPAGGIWGLFGAGSLDMGPAVEARARGTSNRGSIPRSAGLSEDPAEPPGASERQGKRRMRTPPPEPGWPFRAGKDRLVPGHHEEFTGSGRQPIGPSVSTRSQAARPQTGHEIPSAPASKASNGAVSSGRGSSAVEALASN